MTASDKRATAMGSANEDVVNGALNAFLRSVQADENQLGARLEMRAVSHGGVQQSVDTPELMMSSDGNAVAELLRYPEESGHPTSAAAAALHQRVLKVHPFPPVLFPAHHLLPGLAKVVLFMLLEL